MASKVIPLKQASFVGGEISPALHGRTDLERYNNSLRTCLNFIPRPHGGLVNRPGLQFVREVKDSSKTVRLIPFKVGSATAYALEFGENYIRFHKVGATLITTVESGKLHDGGNDASTLTDSGEAFVVDAYIGGTIRNVTDGSQGTITDNDGTTITAILHSGTDNNWDTGDEYSVEMPNEVATPYVEADLARLKFAQINDVMTITHQNHGPRQLKRFSDTNWTLDSLTVDRPVQPPTGVQDTVGYVQPVEGGSATHVGAETEWVVTSIDKLGRESLPSVVYAVAAAVLYVDRVPYGLEWTPPAFGNTPESYNIYRGRNGFFGFVGSTDTTTNANGKPDFLDEAPIPALSDSPASATDPFIDHFSGVSTQRTEDFDDTTDVANDTAIKTLALEAYDDQYIYSWQVSVPVGGTIGITPRYRPAGGGAWTTAPKIFFYTNPAGPDTAVIAGSLRVTADLQAADSEFQLQEGSVTGGATVIRYPMTWMEGDPEVDEASFPAVVAFHDQRQFFGGLRHNLQEIVSSRIGDFNNFDISRPLTDADAIDITIASKVLDEIRFMLSHDNLLVGTASAIYVVKGGDGGGLSPLSIEARPRIAHGTSHVDPLSIGDSALFLSERSNRLREFQQDKTLDRVATRDLSVMSTHIFDDSEIMQMAWAETPFQIVWCVRDDGYLVAMTFALEHEVWGWHRHNTGPVTPPFKKTPITEPVLRDKFEQVISIPEGKEDVVYVVVNRQINGGTKRFVEKFASREYGDIEAAIFMDSALTYDGRNTGVVQIQATGGATWLAEESLTLQATGVVFRASDVGQRYELTAATVAGTHDGADGVGVLSDSGEVWTVDQWIGRKVRNLIDGGEGTVLSNTASTITFNSLGMTGGDRNNWNAGDTFQILPVSVRFEVTAFTDTDTVTATSKAAVPLDMRSVNTVIWARALNAFGGLIHLEGETVGILVDGAVVADQVVASGAITLGAGEWAARAVVGLKYKSDLETLQIHVPADQGGTLRDRRKIISEVVAEVESAVALKGGQFLSELVSWKQRAVEHGYESAINPESKLLQINPKKAWRKTAGIAIRQDLPLPVEILSLITRVSIGD